MLRQRTLHYTSARSRRIQRRLDSLIWNVQNGRCDNIARSRGWYRRVPCIRSDVKHRKSRSNWIQQRVRACVCGLLDWTQSHMATLLLRQQVRAVQQHHSPAPLTNRIRRRPGCVLRRATGVPLITPDRSSTDGFLGLKCNSINLPNAAVRHWTRWPNSRLRMPYNGDVKPY